MPAGPMTTADRLEATLKLEVEIHAIAAGLRGRKKHAAQFDGAGDRHDVETAARRFGTMMGLGCSVGTKSVCCPKGGGERGPRHGSGQFVPLRNQPRAASFGHSVSNQGRIGHQRPSEVSCLWWIGGDIEACRISLTYPSGMQWRLVAPISITSDRDASHGSGACPHWRDTGDNSHDLALIDKTRSDRMSPCPLHIPKTSKIPLGSFPFKLNASKGKRCGLLQKSTQSRDLRGNGAGFPRRAAGSLPCLPINNFRQSEGALDPPRHAL